MEKYKKQLTIALIGAVFVLCVLLVTSFGGKKTKPEETEAAETEEIVTGETDREETETAAVREETETDEESESETVMESETEEPEETQNPLEPLTEELSVLLDDYAGNWSLTLIDKTADQTLQVGEEPAKAASLIKLFIMAAAYDQIHFGYMEDSQEVQDLLKKMITVSDNSAANKLVEMLDDDGTFDAGTHVVNAFAIQHYSMDTYLVRRLGDIDNAVEGYENYTTAADCAQLLSDIYDGTCVSEEASEKMLELLMAQERTGKIPQGLPDGASYGNKTGELPDAEHDAAIVYGEEEDYILCIMADEVPDAPVAASNIASLSKRIYEELNK